MSNPLQRYRLYIDESGDHVFRKLDSLNHRFLCLLGCWFRDDAYKEFHEKLENFKQKHIPHSPDEPVVLHREDILNRRRAFWRLRDPHRAEAFDTDLLSLIGDADFRVVAVVIDKKQLQHEYETPAHPYHLGLGFLLQRYCGYLNHVNRRGDVMAESRGGREDRLLKDSYSRVYERGIWMFRSEAVQRALTSKDLKVKPKSANIAGLQLADLLGHPVRLSILRDKAVTTDPPAPFASRLLEATQGKFNQHLYDGRVWGYGKVIFPDPEKKGPR